MQLFGTSGIRQTVDKSLVRMALNIGLAVGNTYGNAVIGCDTRTSSSALKHALISGLLAGGAQCFDAGILPTPTLAFAAKKFRVATMITASHNPPEYNGIKLLNPDGSAFDSSQRKQIEELILSDSLATAPWDKIGDSSIYSDAVERHVERILQDFPKRLKLKVVVDGGCGAAYSIAPYLLKKLDCQVVALNCHPSGFFPHEVEPTEANLQELIKATRDFDADLGIAHDGDGDRMMAVDDRGRFIPGDKLLAILAQGAGAKKIVTTIDASMSIDELGLEVDRTRVGDPHVSEELKKGGDFGGEPSGSWIFPKISLCPDGIYSAAQLAEIASRQKLSQLVDSLPSYAVLRGSASSQGVVMAQLKPRLLALEPLSVSEVDGIKLNFEDGWLLVRASGTEPKIRLTAEAKTEARAHQLFDSGMAAIQDSNRDSRKGAN